MSANKPKAKFKWDLWMIVTVCVSIFYLLFLLYPLISMLSKSVIAEEGGITWEFFTKFFTKNYSFVANVAGDIRYVNHGKIHADSAEDICFTSVYKIISFVG